MNNSLLENIYDTYSPMLYGIALEIFDTELQAEAALIKTFKLFYKKHLTSAKCPGTFVILLKLIIKTAIEDGFINLKSNKSLRLFENKRVMEYLFLQQKNLSCYCDENNLTYTQGLKLIQQECSLFNRLPEAAIV